MAQPERITVEIELPADPWDFEREGDGLGEISQDVTVFKEGKRIGTATLRLPLENVPELIVFTQAGAKVLKARGLG